MQNHRCTLMEALEPRLLLDASILSPGQSELFDIDNDGCNEVILVNTGQVDLEYDYQGGSGLTSVNLLGDGGGFVTNTWVANVRDNNAADDYDLNAVKIGVKVKKCGKTYCPIDGQSSIDAGSVDYLRIGRGDLLWLSTTEGGADKVYVDSGDVYDAFVEGDVTRMIVDGDVLSSVFISGNVGRLVVENIDGAFVSVSGHLEKLCADQITNYAYVEAGSIYKLGADVINGGASIFSYGNFDKLYADLVQGASVTVSLDMDRFCVDEVIGEEFNYTALSIGGHLNKLSARTISGGLHGLTSIAVGAGLDSLHVGLLEGGIAQDGGFAQTDLAVIGTLCKVQAGLISGGESTGSSSFTMLNVSVDDLLGDDGDINCLRAAAMSGGNASEGGDAMMFLNVTHDLKYASIGQMTGSGLTAVINDPSIYINVGHTIEKLVAGRITAGEIDGEYAFATVSISAGYDIEQICAGEINAGTANGIYSYVEVSITAGRDIGAISADVISGGIATAEGALAAVYVNAARNIDFIGAGLITGTSAIRPIVDPTVQFRAGGDIGVVMAGRITGGEVTSDGVNAAEASVLLRAEGTYVDENGVQSEGNIARIYAGTIRGGAASGANALAYVDISCANDLQKLCADRISGGTADDGGNAYVSIVAEHDIVELCAGVISGSDGNVDCDPSVTIQAYNDIQSLCANLIVAGDEGLVNILAGLDADGNVSGELNEDGEFEAGSIEHMVVGVISGNGGVVNIAAGGDIECLKACRIVSGDGEVNIVAGGDVDVAVWRVRSWSIEDETGVEITAGGEVNDLRNSIRDEYVHEGETVEFPDPAV